MPGQTKSRKVIILAPDKSREVQRLAALYDFVLSSHYFKNQFSNTHPYTLLISMINMLIMKQTAKILFALACLQYSTLYEIEKVTQINTGNVVRIVRKLESYGLVAQLSPDSIDYKIMLRFWRTRYPNSHHNNTYYCIDPSFTKITALFEDVLSNYFTSQEVRQMKTRGQQWLTYKKTVLKQSKAARPKKPIGKCVKCGKKISPDMVKGVDYYRLSRKNLICMRCWRYRATKQEISKWIRMK